MKKIIYTLACTLFILSAQAADITPVANAIKSGNADLLKDKMGEEIDISVPGTSRKSNANEAITLLKKFFQANKVSGFTVVHHADKNESGFFVGKLVTDQGGFRVNVTYTTKDGKIRIRTIRIE
jgi:hypothetical protein